MRSTTRFIAITAGGLLLAAAASTPVLAQSDEEAPTPGTTTMHDHVMGGDSMMGDGADMARMHDQMMAEEPGALPQPDSTP